MKRIPYIISPRPQAPFSRTCILIQSLCMSRFNQEENKLNQVLRVIVTINRSKNICLIFLKY